MTVQATLDKKLGPLPVAGWLMVVGAGVAFAMYRKRAAATTTASPSDQLMTDQTAGNLNALAPLMEALRGGTGPAMSTITDNITWSKRALDIVLGKGYDPSLADAAIRKYVAGDALTQAEQAVINTVLNSGIGGLPFPPPPPVTTPGPGQPITGEIRDILHYKTVDTTNPTIQHLGNVDLINAANITYDRFIHGLAPNSADWAGVIASQYGTSDPLVYMNEIARRYQAGSLTSADFTGPVGSWTSGRPAYIINQQDLNTRLQELAAARPGEVHFGAA